MARFPAVSCGKKARILAGKVCAKCGKTNPRFFTHCVECGAKLVAGEAKPVRIPRYAVAGLAAIVAILLLVFVVVPFIGFSMHSGRTFSENMHNQSLAEAQLTVIPPGQPADNGKLRIAITQARDGQNTYNSQKFFIVLVNLQNLRSDANVQVSNNDFELIGSDNNRYLPYGVGSKVQVDLRPGQVTGEEITYVIPQSVEGSQLHFTFPAEYGLNVNRDEVLFPLS